MCLVIELERFDCLFLAKLSLRKCFCATNKIKYKIKACADITLYYNQLSCCNVILLNLFALLSFQRVENGDGRPNFHKHMT